MARMQPGMAYLGWPEMDKIIEMAEEIAAGPVKYMDHLLKRVVGPPGRLEQWNRLEVMLCSKMLTVMSMWALVLVWEIRLGIQMELEEDPDFALNWQDVDKTGIEYAFVRKCYDIREPVPGWSEYMRNEEEHELEP